MRRVAVCLASGLMLAGGPVADACGDKLVPIGGGVRMERIPRASNPGTVFVLAAPGAQRTKSPIPELMTALAHAGHTARQFDSDDELRAAVRAGAPDVVLAESGTASAEPTQLDALATGPVVVRVLVRPSRDEMARARAGKGCVASIPEWGVSPLVRVVNGIRAAQVSGRPIECIEHARTRS